MSAKYIDIAIMCGACKAIVGSGREAEETIAQMEPIAKAAGLQFLRMWMDPNIQTEECSCPEPKPAQKFANAMSLSGMFEVEIKPKDKGKWEKFQPSFFTKSELRPDDPEKARELLHQKIKEIEEQTGLKGISVGIIEQAIPTKFPNRSKVDQKCLYAFSNEAGMNAS